MESPLDALKSRIFHKGAKDNTELSGIIRTARELSCIGEIIGRDYEVRDSKGNLVYTIRQKPMAMKQLNLLLKEVHGLLKQDAEAEAKKWGKPKRR